MGIMLTSNNMSSAKFQVYSCFILELEFCCFYNWDSPHSFWICFKYSKTNSCFLFKSLNLAHKMEIEQVKCFFTIFLLILFFALFGYESVLKEREVMIQKNVDGKIPVWIGKCPPIQHRLQFQKTVWPLVSNALLDGWTTILSRNYLLSMTFRKAVENNNVRGRLLDVS